MNKGPACVARGLDGRSLRGGAVHRPRPSLRQAGERRCRGIVDVSGSRVVEYEYDAWDKPILMRTLTDIHEALAELNPFRYRGYVWDSELNLCYLQNRFCSIRWNRFINEDNLIRGNLYS